MTEYHTLQELQELAVQQKKEIWQIVQQEDMDASERTQEQSYEKMHQMYEAMKYADASYNGNLRSASGRAGGDGEKLHQYNASGKNICGAFIGLVMEKAIKMGESNACMRRIVAAPTAGSCGVLPAVLLSYEEQFAATEDTGIVCGCRNWKSNCRECFYCRCSRWMSGRDWFGGRNECRCTCLFTGSGSTDCNACSRVIIKEYAGTCL